jgi:hypothetical protein
MTNVQKIKLPNTTLSFPYLFEHASFQGVSTGKFEATFLLNNWEHADLIKQIEEIEDALIKEAKIKLPDERRALRFHNAIEEGIIYKIKGSTKFQPLLVDASRRKTDDRDLFYAGAKVNGLISFWFMNNKFGKRICCNLEGVQFVAHGEKLGGGATVNDFESLEPQYPF